MVDWQRNYQETAGKWSLNSLHAGSNSCTRKVFCEWIPSHFQCFVYYAPLRLLLCRKNTSLAALYAGLFRLFPSCGVTSKRRRRDRSTREICHFNRVIWCQELLSAFGEVLRPFDSISEVFQWVSRTSQSQGVLKVFQNNRENTETSDIFIVVCLRLATSKSKIFPDILKYFRNPFNLEFFWNPLKRPRDAIKLS